MENIIKLTVLKSPSIQILSKITTDKHIYYIKDFKSITPFKFNNELVYTIYRKYIKGNSLFIPTLTTKEGALLLYTDIYTERIECSDDFLINYFMHNGDYNTTGVRVINDEVYKLYEECKVSLNDFSNYDNYELATIELPKCLQTPYSPNNHLHILKEDIIYFYSNIPLLMLSNVIKDKFPVLLDRAGVDKYYNQIKEVKENTYKELCRIFNVVDIDFGRTNCFNNYVVLFVNYCGSLINSYKHIKGKYTTLSKQDLLSYQKEYSNIPDIYNIVSLLLQYKDASYNFSKLNKIVFTPMKTDEHYIFQPDLIDTNTFRIQTVDPNIQGWQPKLRSFIVPPKGYKLADIDIKNQDLHSLFGCLHNQELIQLYEEMQDAYYAVIKYLGYEIDKDKRTAAKVPILAITNGMSEGNAYSQIEARYKPMVKQIFELITNDSGYMKLLDNTQIAISNYKPMKRGYFGLISEVDANTKRRYEIENSILNANFQMTSSEIFRLTIWAFYNHLYKGLIKIKGRTLKPDDFVIGLSIHDEYIFYYRDFIDDEDAKDLIQYYALPIINNRKPMFGHIRVGLNHYEEDK